MKAVPDWFPKIRVKPEKLAHVRRLLEDLALDTVCEGALCPNRPECYSSAHVTVLILGDRCTRACTFCAVAHGAPPPVDPTEPARVAQAAATLKMRHVVVTSVTRDDLPDGGASQYVAVAEAISAVDGAPSSEALIPDFCGKAEAVRRVARSPYAVLAHNVETVPRLYPAVRPQAVYERSLDVLRMLRVEAAEKPVKSGLMLGLGESREEVSRVLQDLSAAGVDVVTLGQYLQPTPEERPVARFVPEVEFSDLAGEARALGFRSVSAGPLVRSSYRAAGALAVETSAG